MNTVESIIRRKSQPRLKAPAPDDTSLSLLLKAAVRAPDHAKLKPWRFRIYSDAGISKLVNAFEAAVVAQNPEISEEQLQKLRAKPRRAPMVIVASAFITQHPKVPEIEQILSVGAAVQNILLAADALNYGAIWRTGSLTYNPHLKSALGMDANEKIVGFIYLGTVDGEPMTVRETDANDFVTFIRD